MVSSTVRSFVEDPHTAVVGEPGTAIINLADSRAENARKHIVEMTKEDPREVVQAARSVSLGNHHDIRAKDVNLKRLGAVLAMSHGEEINNFEDLLLLKGIGPRTLRSLALTSELIHGDASRFDDPARFSFAVGGKDGRPHPIDRTALRETINHLQDSVEQSKMGYNEKSKALKRLHRATRHIEDTREPQANLDDLVKSEWEHSEKSGGMTFMGKVIPGLTKAIVGMQNSLLYGTRDGQTG